MVARGYVAVNEVRWCGGGAGERVDGLARVTDDAQLLPAAEPLVEQVLLERADVLVLVDDEVPVLVAHRVGDVPPLGQHGREQEQHVLEVDDALLVLGLLVRRHEPRDGLRVDAPGPGRSVAAAALA